MSSSLVHVRASHGCSADPANGVTAGLLPRLWIWRRLVPVHTHQSVSKWGPSSCTIPERLESAIWWSIDWRWDWSSTAWDPLGVPGSTRGVPGLCISFWKCDLRAAVLTRAGCHCLCLWPQRPQGLRTPSNRVLVYLWLVWGSLVSETNEVCSKSGNLDLPPSLECGRSRLRHTTGNRGLLWGYPDPLSVWCLGRWCGPQIGTAGSKARSQDSESLPCQYITIAGLVSVPHMVILMGPKGALVWAALGERRSMERVFVNVKCPKGEP